MLGDAEVLAQTRGGAVSYYLYDGQGSVRLLTDGNGAITDLYTYDAFGNALTSQGSTVNPYRYTGQQFDSLTGLYDLRARYYDPMTGRFLSRDTALIDFSNPVELNRYSYAEDNPVNLVDPSGHQAFEEYQLLNAQAPPRAKPTIGPIGILTAAILLWLLYLLLTIPGLLTNVQGLVQSLTQTQQKQRNSHPDEVIIDNNALEDWQRVEDENLLQGQKAVITVTVLYESCHCFDINKIPRKARGKVKLVPDEFDPAVAAQILTYQNSVSAKDNVDDAIIGGTMFYTDRGLITFDNFFCAALMAANIYGGIHSPYFRLRPTSGNCLAIFGRIRP